MAQQGFPGYSCYWLATIIPGILALLYFAYKNAYPKPLPGIPHNIQALRRLAGDLPEIQERQKDGASIRPWFLEQAHRHGPAIMQNFLGPFAKPAILISDFREVNDILMYREADFKKGKKFEVFSGILPHAHPAMETFDPRFKSTRDVMTPSFLHSVSAPNAYDIAINLVELWRLKNRMARGRPFPVANHIVELSFDAILNTATGLGDSGGDIRRQLLHLRKFESDIPLVEDGQALQSP